MAFRIEPTITEGEYMVIEDSDPSVANIVFDGTYGDCQSFIRDEKSGGTVYRSPANVTCPTCKQGPEQPCQHLNGSGIMMQGWHPRREHVEF